MGYYSKNAKVEEGASLPDGIRRYGAIVEYLGTSFQGFQRQSNTENTVQEKLETALTYIANEPIAVSCAGRTDAGVHATRQVIHFDTSVNRTAKAWVEGGNTKLPDDIRIQFTREVKPQFHSRFSAFSRTYRYVFYTSPIKPTFMHSMVTWVKSELDERAMQEASQYLVGELDFSSFRAAQCQSISPFRNIEYVRFDRYGPFLVMEIKANAFLHHMVRNIAGSMMSVGRGQRQPIWINEVLQAKDRTLAAATAPPNGLFLVGVGYPSQFDWPSSASGPEFLKSALGVRP